MNRILRTAVLALALALFAPAVASAHHLIDESSDITCTSFKAVFQDFAEADTPVSWGVLSDGEVVASGVTDKTGDFTVSGTLDLPPGTHRVAFGASWPTGDGEVVREVTCEAPVVVPPPPVVTPPAETPPVANPCPAYNHGSYKLVKRGQKYRLKGPGPLTDIVWRVRGQVIKKGGRSVVVGTMHKIHVLKVRATLGPAGCERFQLSRVLPAKRRAIPHFTG